MLYVSFVALGQHPILLWTLNTREHSKAATSGFLNSASPFVVCLRRDRGCSILRFPTFDAVLQLSYTLQSDIKGCTVNVIMKTNADRSLVVSAWRITFVVNSMIPLSSCTKIKKGKSSGGGSLSYAPPRPRCIPSVREKNNPLVCM